ncbi:P-loop containing nucleoside triphosphate hydrolase protein [Lactarius quietus]|nr:P-loop containing nucleoside triphosphate hydrolase protein [Lactarius quietus]
MAVSQDTPISRRLNLIKHVIIVCSGKGGVGKSSVAVQLALSLYMSSPNISISRDHQFRACWVDGHGVHQSSDDASHARLACMSVGFLLKKKNDSVVWRGPKKNAMIRQFLGDHLSPTRDRIFAVLVTTPQAVALMDAMKCLSFTRAVNLPVLGIVENMSGYVCPCCGEVSNVFSTGGGQEMARKEGVPFLGALPVDTELVALLDAGEAALREGSGSEIPDGEFGLAKRYQETPSAKLFGNVVNTMLGTLPGRE